MFKNQKLIKVELYPTQIDVCVACLRHAMENKLVPKKVANWVINPIVQKMEEKLNENK